MPLLFISVVICTYNREKFIVKCLECLKQQTLNHKDFEVIIVNNNCTDNTAQVVNIFLEKNPLLPFRMVFEHQKGLSYARNRGIAEAKNEIILFLDDDAESEPELLKEYQTFFINHVYTAGAGGRILPRYSEAPEPPWISRWLDGYIARMDPGGVTRVFTGRMKYPFGCNMAYRKKLLEEIGGFNTDLTFRGDDKYIFLQIKKINPQIYYLPKALVFHNIPKARLESEYFKVLFLKTGNEERKSNKNNFVKLIGKFFEFFIKFNISLILWLKFSLTHSEIKGRYIMLSQLFTLIGFLRKEVNVR